MWRHSSSSATYGYQLAEVIFRFPTILSHSSTGHLPGSIHLPGSKDRLLKLNTLRLTSPAYSPHGSNCQGEDLLYIEVESVLFFFSSLRTQ